MEPDWAKGNGLLPCVTVDAATGDVLTLAYVNAEALEATIATGEMHYWSRSRNCLWRKGEESGNGQDVVSISLDCDGDAFLSRVRPRGPACHTGAATCFHNAVHGEGESGLAELERVIADRVANPREGSHTTRLLADENLRLKKVAEEAGEVIMAAKDGDRARLTSEIADLVYHALVAGAAAGVMPRDVLRELAQRRAGVGRGSTTS